MQGPVVGTEVQHRLPGSRTAAARRPGRDRCRAVTLVASELLYLSLNSEYLAVSNRFAVPRFIVAVAEDRRRHHGRRGVHDITQRGGAIAELDGTTVASSFEVSPRR